MFHTEDQKKKKKIQSLSFLISLCFPVPAHKANKKEARILIKKRNVLPIQTSYSALPMYEKKKSEYKVCESKDHF